MIINSLLFLLGAFLGGFLTYRYLPSVILIISKLGSSHEEEGDTELLIGGHHVIITETTRGLRIATPNGAPDKELCDYMKREGILIHTDSGLKLNREVGEAGEV